MTRRALLPILAVALAFVLWYQAAEDECWLLDHRGTPVAYDTRNPYCD